MWQSNSRNKYSCEMNKILLMTLLAIVSNSAVAEWLYVARNDQSYVYVDPSTIRKAGNRTGMLVLFDFKTADETRPFMSTKAQSEYECKEEQYRITRTYLYSENMGRGESEKSDTLTPWRLLQTGSAWKYLWSIACLKQPQ